MPRCAPVLSALTDPGLMEEEGQTGRQSKDCHSVWLHRPHRATAHEWSQCGLTGLIGPLPKTGLRAPGIKLAMAQSQFSIGLPWISKNNVAGISVPEWQRAHQVSRGKSLFREPRDQAEACGCS